MATPVAKRLRSSSHRPIDTAPAGDASPGVAADGRLKGKERASPEPPVNDLPVDASLAHEQTSSRTSDRHLELRQVDKRRLFAPFRALSLYSNDIPFVLLSRSSPHLKTPVFNLITCLGSSWAMWDVKTLSLILAGEDCGGTITALAATTDEGSKADGGGGVYAAFAVDNAGLLNHGSASKKHTAASFDPDRSPEDQTGQNGVRRFYRGKITATLPLPVKSPPSQTGRVAENGISALNIFGTTLVGLAEDGRSMFVWDTLMNGLHTTIEFPADFTATKLVHPSTYINKVVVGSREGELAIWNVSTGQLIHTFASTEVRNSVNRRKSAVTQLVQSPALDVLAIGFEDGIVTLFDVKAGDLLAAVQMTSASSMSLAATDQMTERSEKLSIAGIAFRDDNESHTMATVSRSGDLAIWDLKSADDESSDEDDDAPATNLVKLLHLERRAHDDSIGGVQFLPGQPVMITTGADNAIKQWLFDSPLSPPRLLKHRSGHHKPPNLIRYYGDDGKAMLSAGRDQALRYTSVVRESRSHELSQQGATKKAAQLGKSADSLKLATISSMAFSTARASDWDNVLTTHLSSPAAYSWSVRNKRKGAHTLSSTSKGVPQGSVEVSGSARCVHVTACGHFGLVGYAELGQVLCWNLQSGIWRKAFQIPRSSLTNGRTNARALSVSGVAVDALNQIAVVATLSGDLHFFDFHTTKLVRTTKLASGIYQMLLQRDNGLIAVACDDMIIRIVDIETMRTVRELSGFRGRVLDLAFSPDSRWLIACSLDYIIRTFDLPTSKMIDAFRCASLATSLTFSPTGDFLATAHIDSVGVFLWANRAQFAEVSLRSVVDDESPELVGLPTVSEDAAEGLDALADEEDQAASELTLDKYLGDGLATLTLMPRSKWQTLLNLDTIKSRNKPVEPPKAPAQAPFFLPTLPGTETRFDLSSQLGQNATDGDEITSRVGLQTAQFDSEFARRLTEDTQGFFAHAISLPPSTIDVEIRSLSPDQLVPFIKLLTQRLRSHQDFEAIQALLAVFLRTQGESIISSVGQADAMEKQAILDALDELRQEQRKGNDRIGRLIGFSLGALGFVRNVTT
ncbi:hypothetical protein E5Q_03685 [Mixia osmundae IAM 14324]|uniref:Small-subunit processome Utp21 domain-containing protein n=1 Tax=Mixia osmundae (strain CBS 9802 / IAM 14324 / JCM 22182 / KY 12970) TaxID=764103 RepID=G7E2F1_MIXOS|nr:hypothetical protein E5Q_03685 [Mixia osmundae IAM 14324]